MKIIVTCKYGVFESDDVPHTDEEVKSMYRIAELAAADNLSYLEIDGINGKRHYFPREILIDSVITVEE